LKKITFVLALSLITLLSTAQTALPEVKVKDIKGKETSFASLFSNNDTITIVSFWATWCGPCVKEIDAFTDKLEDWQKLYPIKLMGISVDDSRTSNRVKSFIKGRGWDFANYQDVNNDLKRALNIPNVPHTMAIKNGIVLFQTDGYVPGNEDEIIEKIKKGLSK
jgi:cytochrome c biogenesis protein CcmG, thiol:disulfide interchange protein DsbE